MQVSDDREDLPADGEKDKHSDNHSIAFRMDDPDYLLVGTDGGIYETFDLAKTWRFVANLPITQFYKVAVDEDGRGDLSGPVPFEGPPAGALPGRPETAAFLARVA